MQHTTAGRGGVWGTQKPSHAVWRVGSPNTANGATLSCSKPQGLGPKPCPVLVCWGHGSRQHSRVIGCNPGLVQHAHSFTSPDLSDSTLEGSRGPAEHSQQPRKVMTHGRARHRTVSLTQDCITTQTLHRTVSLVDSAKDVPRNSCPPVDTPGDRGSRHTTTPKNQSVTSTLIRHRPCLTSAPHAAEYWRCTPTAHSSTQPGCGPYRTAVHSTTMCWQH